MEISGDTAKLVVGQAGSVLYHLRFENATVDEVITTKPMNIWQDGPFARDLPIRRQLTIKWNNCTYDPTEINGQNYYQNNLQIGGGNILSVWLYLNGVMDMLNAFYAPQFLFDGPTMTISASMLQPWSVGGKSQGTYKTPYSNVVLTGNLP